MEHHSASKLFKASSTTYYFSSIFFPKKLRQAVFDLYAFVRLADNHIDKDTPQIKEFDKLCSDYFAKNSECPIVSNFIELEKKYKFEPEWTKAFLDSMRIDLIKKTYETIEELEEYIYGSADIIGLYMSKLINLPKESYEFAMLQGKSMQFINFIRDIKEDLEWGRVYMPQEDLRKFKLKSLSEEDAKNNPEGFINLIHYEIDRYNKWQNEAYKGFKFIPKRYRFPIKTAVDQYNWTADVIKKNPFIIYKTKVKPSSLRVISNGLFNILFG